MNTLNALTCFALDSETNQIKVAGVLFKHPCSLSALVRLTKLSKEQIKQALQVLLQHHLLTIKDARRPTEDIRPAEALRPIYTIDAKVQCDCARACVRENM